MPALGHHRTSVSPDRPTALPAIADHYRPRLGVAGACAAGSGIMEMMPAASCDRAISAGRPWVRNRAGEADNPLCADRDGRGASRAVSARPSRATHVARRHGGGGPPAGPHDQPGNCALRRRSVRDAHQGRAQDLRGVARPRASCDTAYRRWAAAGVLRLVPRSADGKRNGFSPPPELLTDRFSARRLRGDPGV